MYAPKIFQSGKLAMRDPVIFNAADGSTALSPGSVASMRGTGLSNCRAQNRNLPLPLTLCGTTVSVNGQPAPLFYVSPGQINLLVPRGLNAGQDVLITVTREDGDTGTETLPGARFAASAGGVFLYVLDGVLRAVVQNPSAVTNGPKTPLKPNAAVVYAGGLGATDLAVPDTSAAPRDTLVRTVADVQVVVNGRSQNIFFSGLTPGQFGLYQVNFILDPDTPILENDGNSIWLTVDGRPTAQARISLSAK